jgi:mRNA deadenylase 3'-5' endonuclease subunit Ccr4
LEFTCILYCTPDGIIKSIKTESTVGFPEMNLSRTILNIPRETLQTGKIDYMGTSLFRLTSYNLMAQSRVLDQFPDCPSYAVQWVYRKRVLFSEIKLLDSDISCLQEMPSKEVSEYWDIELSKLGFSSFIPDKTSKAGQLVNTLGIFFRRVKFGMVKQWTIDYDHTIPLVFSQVQCLTNQFAVVVLLEFKDLIKDGPSKMIVANTQLSSEMGKYQIQVLHKALSDMVTKESPQEYRIPVVICASGEYGSNQTSEVYNYILESDLNVTSLYKKGLGKEPSLKVGKTVKDTADFVFASNDFVLTQVMEFDDKMYPSQYSCSDHCPLYVELDVKK